MVEELREVQAESSENPFVEKFEEFFKVQSIKKQVERLIGSYPEKKSLTIDFKELEQFDYQLADELLANPDNVLQGAQIAIQKVEVPALEIDAFSPHVRFFNLPKDSTVLIRDVSAKHLGKLMAIEGVVRQFNQVQPKLKMAIWKCRRCGNSYKMEQDGFSIKMPAMCECKHRDFELNEPESTFINHQKIGVQEPLEKLKGSEQANTLDVHALDDLVNKVTPGDKTIIVGILRLYPPQKDKHLIYGRYLEALSIQEKEREFEEMEVSKEEEEEIKKFSKKRNAFEVLRQSIAPSIYGHDTVKDAIVLQLFNGVKKTLPGEMKVRGNIHVLLVGDPGCLVGDERVALGNGSIERIMDLGKEHLQELQTQVLTGEGGKKRDWATCFHYYKQQPVIEIITESGKSIKGTLNHPLLCVSKENSSVKRAWKRLDEFKIGDKVASVTKIPCTITAEIPTGFKTVLQENNSKAKGKLPEKVSKKLAGFLGYCIGDGWAQKYRIGFVVSEEEIDLLPKLLEASEELFGIKPSLEKKKLKNGRKVQMHYAIIHSKNIAKNLSFLQEKRIPKLIMRSGNKVAAEFIKWLFEADGCVFSKGRGKRAIALKAKNIELLRDVQMLLLRFGIHSRITENALQIRRGKDIIKFSKSIGFASEKKKSRMKQLAKDAESFGRFNSQRSERIVKIIKHSPEDVFDIEVPKTHRFIANGIISHNTAKSQMLRAIGQIAPKSIYAAGKTTSGVGLCVAPDTLILNDNGFKEIKEFVEDSFDEKKAIEEIQGAFSNQFNSKNANCLSPSLKMEEKPIYKIWRIKAPEKMFKIKTRSGKEIKLTPNTSLPRIKDGKVEWIKSSLLEAGDFVATARKLPQGKQKVYCAEILSSHQTIRIQNNVSKEFSEITNKLIKKKNCTLEELAKSIGLKKERFYRWRMQKFYQGIPLSVFWKLGIEAGIPKNQLAGKIKTVFSRYGKNINIPERLDNEKLCYLAGLALGDGSLYEGKNTAQLRIWSADRQILETIEEYVEELFAIKAEKIKDHNGLEGRRIKYFEAIELLKELGLAKKEKIALSHSTTEQSNKSIKEILSGLFDTDGYASNARAGSSHVGFTTISKKLAQTTSLALLKFGILSKIRLRKRAGNKAFSKGLLIQSKHDQYCVEIRGKNNLELFEQEIGFKLERKKKALEIIIGKISKENTNIDTIPEIKKLTGFSFNPSRKFLKANVENDKLLNLSESDVFWDEIKEKTEFSPDFEFVYDFSVRENHNFIANGFFVHNTASAEKDEFGEGGWTLKAGALVLASGGMAMIDEFDKMNPEDRSSMHEALEQGTISIAKAGIVTTFRTDTSVLAAANPKYARFDAYMNSLEQVDLPPTLISRFDLLFLIKDNLDRKKDEDITDFILKRHQEGEKAIHEKKFQVKMDEVKTESVNEESVDPEFLKKYISYARQKIFPIMTDAAMNHIREFYLKLRDMGRQDKVYAATHRQLEALIRLSEASARVRLKDFVEEEDTERATRIFRASLDELAIDKETGKLDIDLITSGQASSKTSQIKKIVGIIREKTQDGRSQAAYDEVVKIAVSEGIDEDRAKELISDLKKKGELYEPTLGWLKMTDRKD
ncbi:MAG: LAGLIDADG family homing endonuclease [Candidatus Diapherotrites archaeon]|nr:LAGLIDADG family homing endonuclease [Candidatus Diapherotrites archaeon]